MSSHSSQAHAESTSPTSSSITTAFTPSVSRLQELAATCKLKKKRLNLLQRVDDSYAWCLIEKLQSVVIHAWSNRKEQWQSINQRGN